MKAITIPSDYYSENQTRYVFIDGNCCRSLDECYATLRKQLSLPDYFGNNLDALEEVLEDMEWIQEEKIKIIILNKANFLGNSAKKESLLNIFTTAQNQKLEIIFVGEGE